MIKKLSILCLTLLLFTRGMCSLINLEEDRDLWEDPFSSKRVSPFLVGQQAPDFTAKAVVDGTIIDNFSLKDFRGQYVIFFFYPLDFTFVCPTELHAFQEKINEFKARNAQVIACSVDSHFSHLAWWKIPRSLGGIQEVTYPIVSDLDKSIARSFNTLDEEEAIAYRGLFLIDRSGIIRHLLINDLPLGRSVDETLRLLDALITFENEGVVCPANWHPGDKTMIPTSEGLTDFFSTTD
jgi:peroxiredoxin 2/4